MFKPWEKWVLFFGALIAANSLYEVATYVPHNQPHMIAQK